MSKLFGCLINDPHLLQHALFPFRDMLTVSEAESPFGWGIAHHVHQEVLRKEVFTKRRPRHVGELDFFKYIKDIEAHSIMAQVRQLRLGSATPENTQPFTFRSWSCGHTGYVARFEQIRPWILNSIPNFLRRNIKGVTDSEAVFHLFLAFLYDEGVLDAYDIGIDVAHRALKSTIKTVQRFVVDAGGGESGLNLLVTNGRIMLVCADTLPVYSIHLQGLSDCDLCRMPPETWNAAPRQRDHENVRFSMMLVDPPETSKLVGFKRHPERCIVASDQRFLIEELDYAV